MSQDLVRLEKSLEATNKKQLYKYKQVMKSLKVIKLVHEAKSDEFKELISRLSHQKLIFIEVATFF